jgi:hypothetical protein
MLFFFGTFPFDSSVHEVIYNESLNKYNIVKLLFGFSDFCKVLN